MKNLFETTTGTISSQMILEHCGDYAGRFQDKAFELIDSLINDELSFINNQWCDIMFDRQGRVYAIFATDALTCQDAEVLYVELDEEDCPEAFAGMREKLDSNE